MSAGNANVDEAFLTYLENGSYVSALEAETLRTEFRRKKSLEKQLTMLAFVIRKGHFTREQGQQLFDIFSKNGSSTEGSKSAQPPDAGMTLVENPHWRTNPMARQVDDESDDIALEAIDAEADWTDEPTAKAPPRPEQKPTRQVQEPPKQERPTHRPLNDSGTKRHTDKHTSNVEDSRSNTGRKTTDRKATGNTSRSGTGSKGAGWSLHDDSDAVGDVGKEVPAGTIIAGSAMTIAQVREQMELGEGVKLISDKMQSSLAQFQPDATSDKKRYVVIREIARGGMGKVLEVEDTELRRSVALKVLRKELLGRRDIVERFLEEAQITGQLEHPNIVPVHEMGVDGAGNLYFTMKFVEGLSLAEILLKLREGNRDLRREYPLLKLLDIFIKICEGMSFAHNRGVIHRDLKPANIMVGKFGEVQVMDWGVAKVVGREFVSDNDSGIVMTDRLDSGSVHTMMGSVIGTPSYMSPEQARGDLDAIGPKTDIFSMGVILYEMLALRSPWTGKTSDEVLEQVRELTPIKPSQRNPEVEVPAELERLALLCLEKDLEARPKSVKELAENIRNFTEGRAMGSVDYSPIRLFMKWVGRNKKEVAGVMLTIVLVIGGIVGTLWYIRKVDEQRVLGLNDDAEVILEEWRPLANDRKFNEADEKLDEAKQLFQRVLAVIDGDERATAGLEAVSAAHEDVRRMRIAALAEESRAELIAMLLKEGEDLAAEAKATPLYAERLMGEAASRAQAVLAVEKDNVRARRLKADACRELAQYALDRSRLGLCSYWLGQWAQTGLYERERKAMEFEVQRRGG
ncbi:MAG: protein kinase [Planctomycetes bacterium]|nr:protein kinase [Planctomycetota bacterium]MCW8134677.1 protein kinase [Planctomycetota bacterium]